MVPGGWMTGKIRILILTAIFGFTAKPLLSYTDYLDKAKIPHKPENYVTDLADVLTAQQETLLNNTLSRFEKNTTNQFFILIAPTTAGFDHEDLSLHVAEAWKPGQVNKDNGILLSLYLKEHKIRLDVGYGLEGSLPDITSKRIIMNDMVPHMKKGKRAVIAEQRVHQQNTGIISG